MSYEILSKEALAKGVVRMTISAGEAARHASAGQFAVVMADVRGERIPLTIVAADPGRGTITLIFQEIGASTARLARMGVGETLFAVLGPLGKPTAAEKAGTVVCVAGGVGIAEVLPVVSAFKAAGNRVIVMVGSRTRELVILEQELRRVCDDLKIATDDGSYGAKAVVTVLLEDFLSRETPALVYAVGPVVMMKKVAEITRPGKIKTVVSLNPVMVDATGMCGVCRCTVAGKTVFGCVDGPEFDAHQVDFDALERRLGFLKEEEAAARARTH